MDEEGEILYITCPDVYTEDQGEYALPFSGAYTIDELTMLYCLFADVVQYNLREAYRHGRIRRYSV